MSPGPVSIAQIRVVRDLVREATGSLTDVQRAALVDLLDEIGMGIAALARASRDYPGEAGVHRCAEAGYWQRTAASYARLLAAGTTS